MTGRAVILQGDARRLPLPDESVDLIVTSPPYWNLRDYGYPGQLGSEATWQEYIANLLDCTREWIRVLKPTGSMFVNLGDKYSGAQAQNHGRAPANSAVFWQRTDPKRTGIPGKSLMDLPARYAIASVDELGLIKRAEIIWAKPNGLPESVTDRVRRAHEQIFHLVKQPRYYAAVDEIREPHTQQHSWGQQRQPYLRPPLDTSGVLGRDDRSNTWLGQNPLGKLPGSVWSIPSAPLTVPPSLGVDHFAAFPPALVRPLVLGWSPPGVCTACGEGRRPTTDKRVNSTQRTTENRSSMSKGSAAIRGVNRKLLEVIPRGHDVTITGYVCACTTTDLSGPDVSDYAKCRAGEPPTRPAIVLDPFAGTGTTPLVAAVHGRTGIGVDLSHDYCRLARWRVNDPGERARALNVPKPPPVMDGQDALFTL